MKDELAGSIFGAQPSKLISMPWLVTIQFQFKIEAQTKQGAELSIMKGITIPVIIAPAMVSYGVEAEQLTKEMLQSMGINLEKKT